MKIFKQKLKDGLKLRDIRIQSRDRKTEKHEGLLGVVIVKFSDEDKDRIIS